MSLERDSCDGIVPGLCLALIVTLTIAFAVTGLIVRPAMYSDAAWGMMGWAGMSRGAPFNYSLLPDPANISKDVLGFMSWWSPGQHVLPGLLERSGIELGVAFVLVVVVFSALGLAGWFALYRAFGFARRTSLIALAIVVCSRFYNLPYNIYNGGEILLFGVAPWFLLLVWRQRDLRWSSIPALCVGALALFFAKVSGIILAAAAIGAAAVCGDGAWWKRQTIRRIGVAVTAIGLIAAVFYFGWLSRGATALPSSPELQWSRLLTHTAFCISAMVTASFSAGDLASYIFLHPGRPLLESIDWLYFGFAPAALAVIAFVCWRLREGFAEYLRFVFLIAAAVTVALVAVWVAGGTVSIDERHLRSVALLLLVGLVHACIAHPRPWPRVLLVLAAVPMSLYGLSSFVGRTNTMAHDPLGSRGFRHTIASQAELDFIRKIDVVGPGGEVPLVLVTSPEIALEFRHARTLANQADFDGMKDLSSHVYRGRVARLYVLVQRALVANGKADVMLRSFVDYTPDKWNHEPIGDYVAFWQ